MLEPRAGLIIAERYRLDDKLGEGGMGSVWSAHDEKLRRQVAIKLVTERISESKRALARFEREAMSVARLRSPHIAQVYDYGVEDGSPYIIMELLSGEDLKALLARDIRLSLQDTARIVVQVSKALHAAHSTGIVHRDLKPANIFIAEEHGEKSCKVFDFGVAKALNDLADDGDATAEGVLLGTPRYMSPEQAHGAKTVDHRTDLWSLGVIAYVCVTGRLPFIAAGTGLVLVKVCTEDPPPPSELIAHLPKSVDQFFAKALAKEPADRFQSAQDMGIAFAELAEVSVSSFSLSSSPGRDGSPSWTGISGSYPGTPIAISAADDTSVDSPQGKNRASAGDGTLGAATRSPLERGSRLGSRGAIIVAGAAATVAVAVLIGVASMRSDDGAPSQAAPSVAPIAAETGAAVDDEPSTADVASTAPAAASSPSAEPSHKSAPVPAPVVAGRPRPKASAEEKTAEVPPSKPEPPKPKNKDGLDLFNGRF